MRYILIVTLALAGCATTQRAAGHQALNALTDVAQPLYDGAVAQCSSVQWGIIQDRDDGRSNAEKKVAVGRVRTKCHKAYAAFDRVITAQQEARALLDAETVADQVAVLAKIEEVRNLIRDAQRLLSRAVKEHQR